MTETRCQYCDSPYDDDRDENGLPFCDCLGAQNNRLKKECDELKARAEQAENDMKQLKAVLETMGLEVVKNESGYIHIAQGHKHYYSSGWIMIT